MPIDPCMKSTTRKNFLRLGILAAAAALFVILLAPLPPAAAGGSPTVLVPWGSDWDYAIVPNNACGNFNGLFPSCAFQVGSAPFGNSDPICGTTPHRTTWEGGANDLILTRHIVAPLGSTVLIEYRGDDRIVLERRWDGVAGSTPLHTSGELGMCVISGSTTVLASPPSVGLSHTFQLGVRVRDYYGDTEPNNLALFDMQISHTN